MKNQPQFGNICHNNLIVQLPMRTAEIPLQCLQESKPPVERVVYFIPIRRQKERHSRCYTVPCFNDFLLHRSIAAPLFLLQQITIPFARYPCGRSCPQIRFVPPPGRPLTTHHAETCPQRLRRGRVRRYFGKRRPQAWSPHDKR